MEEEGGCVDLLFERYYDLFGWEFEVDFLDVSRNGYFVRRGYREIRKGEFWKFVFFVNDMCFI